MIKPGGNSCLDIEIDLKTDHVEDQEDVEAALEVLLELIDRHVKRSQPNIKSPLEVNIGT